MHCKMCIFGVGYLCALVTNIQEHQELCVGQEDSPRAEPSPTFKDDSLSVHLHATLMLLLACLQRFRKRKHVLHTFIVYVLETMSMCVCASMSLSQREKRT